MSERSPVGRRTVEMHTRSATMPDADLVDPMTQPDERLSAFIC